MSKWTAVPQHLKLVETRHQGDWRLGVALQREPSSAICIPLSLENREIVRCAAYAFSPVMRDVVALGSERRRPAGAQLQPWCANLSDFLEQTT